MSNAEVDIEEMTEHQEDTVNIATPVGSGNEIRDATKVPARGFNFDDYLTVVIRNQLGLPEDWEKENVKVGWSVIEEAYNGLSIEKKTEKADWWEYMQRNRHGRQKRYEILCEALERHGLNMRHDSKLCRDFVFKNHGDKREIVRKMYVMKQCYDNGAVAKFNSYLEDMKQKNPAAARADRFVSLRDMFFDRFYQDLVLEHPEIDFRWKPHPNLVSTPSTESRQPYRGGSRGRGFRVGSTDERPRRQFYGEERPRRDFQSGEDRPRREFQRGEESPRREFQRGAPRGRGMGRGGLFRGRGRGAPASSA